MPDEPTDEQRQQEEAELREFCKKHPEHLKSWVDTDTNAFRFAGDKPRDEPIDPAE